MESYSNIIRFVESSQKTKITSIKPVKNGRNSQVFLVWINKWRGIVKKYFQNSSDKRNRLKAEVEFLKILNENNIRQVAALVDYSKKKNLCLFTYLSKIKCFRSENSGG